jgi:lauroyl/myristoyl acyltransferase
MRHSYGRSRLRSLRLTWDYLNQPLRDFVILRRLISKQENPRRWKIVEVNGEGIERLRTSGRPYIVATGHFAREALMSISSPTVTPAPPFQVSHEPSSHPESPQDVRVWLQLTTLLAAQQSCWERPFNYVYAGGGHLPFRKLVRALSDGPAVVFVGIDAPWHRSGPGAYERPFAGFEKRAFATGVAQLARWARCPVIGCVYRMDGPRRRVIEWGTPIECDGNSSPTEREIMDSLLDFLEVAVGRYPEQYVLEIGSERRWDEGRRRWYGARDDVS